MTVLSFSQCKKEVAPEPVDPVDPPVVEEPAVTLEAEGLSDTSVELKGMADPGPYDVKDLVVGFQYSESRQFPIGATNVLADFIDDENRFLMECGRRRPESPTSSLVLLILPTKESTSTRSLGRTIPFGSLRRGIVMLGEI